MDFYEGQLQKEIKYIEDKYFSSLIRKDFTDVKIKDDFIEKRVILNKIPYKMYIKKSKDFDIMFIPETSDNRFNFINDFYEIIKYKKTNNEIHFSIISKKDNYINLVDYLFFTNENGYSSGNYFHDSFFDENYILQSESLKINTSILHFLHNLNIINLNNTEYRLNRIKRNYKETKLNKINESSLLKAYQLYDSRFTKIDDNESPIISIFESMYKKDNVKTRI